MTSDNQGDPRLEPRLGGEDDGFGPDLIEEPAVQRASRSGRTRLLTIGIAVAALAGFSAIAWYATTEGRKDQASVVPVVPADISPIKERPEQPGGLDVPNRDKQVFERINPEPEKPPVERMLPPPETPVAKPAAPSKPATVAEAPAKPPEGPIVPEAPAMSPQPPAPGTAGAPSTPEAKPAMPAPPPLVSKALPSAGFQVQLGALRNEARAKRTAAALAKKHADLFKSMTVGTVRADLGSRGVFYRLRAGPIASRAAAEALCSKLAARKQGCIVIKP